MGTHGTGPADAAISMRKLLSRRAKTTEWNMPVCLAQTYFTRAYDGVRQETIQRTKLRRGVSAPVVAVYTTDMRTSELTFTHAGWRTRSVRPLIGLRQGCSLGPFAFRWKVEDAVDAVREHWERSRCGIQLDGHVSCCRAWVDDTWLFAASAQELDGMTDVLKCVAWDLAGLRVRIGRCTRASAARTDVMDLSGVEVGHRLRAMCKVPCPPASA